jgi:murein L,D-transpeptidase YafK
MVSISNITFPQALNQYEETQKHHNFINKPITADDVKEYLFLRKIVGDTIGKTANYIKIIKLARAKFAQGEFIHGLYPKIDYLSALVEAEEYVRLRDLVDKVLVIKSQRKLYLQKDRKTVKTFAIDLGPKPIGQKEYEGDGKTPEGNYTLDWQRHETGNFHSFHISYPNALDSARAKTKGLKPGNNIMVHGTPKGLKKKKDWTNGCIALNNEDMAEFRRIVFQDTAIEIKK